MVARVRSVFLGQIVDCLTSGRKSGETVGFEGKEVEDSTSLPPVLDFHETIHHMWPVDAFHSAKDVVFTPDFRVSGGDVAEADGCGGHDGSFPVAVGGGERHLVVRSWAWRMAFTSLASKSSVSVSFSSSLRSGVSTGPRISPSLSR